MIEAITYKSIDRALRGYLLSNISVIYSWKIFHFIPFRLSWGHSAKWSTNWFFDGLQTRRLSWLFGAIIRSGMAKYQSSLVAGDVKDRGPPTTVPCVNSLCRVHVRSGGIMGYGWLHNSAFSHRAAILDALLRGKQKE
ncbi:hypothetical protein BY996DRAFT_6423302 [Phakopsora pachyrhizi]|nr:hypothetical protein BY996DRAFT_6423302 [Phakopsora pachyrhizi]